MTACWFFGVALLVGLVTARVPASQADEPPIRMFHIGTLPEAHAPTPRTSPLRIGCASWAMSKAAT